MKKILLAALAVMVMSISAFAVDGTVNKIKVTPTGAVLIWIEQTGTGNIYAKWLVGTPDAKKTMYATLLTAKTTNAEISLYIGTVDSINGWNTVIMK